MTILYMELGRSWLVIMAVQCEEPQESNTTMSIVLLDYSLSQLPRKKQLFETKSTRQTHPHESKVNEISRVVEIYWAIKPKPNLGL